MLRRFTAQLLDDAYAFVAEAHRRVPVVLIGATDAAVRDFDDGLRGAGGAAAAAFNDGTRVRAFEDRECGGHLNLEDM